jgi:hypothetical protein
MRRKEEEVVVLVWIYNHHVEGCTDHVLVLDQILEMPNK